MPLNISIDVDGTLLDEDENADPQTRNLIEQLKGQGHRIQLWSTGGADYALRRATEKGLANLFDSFGTKPDVAIDDIPESAHAIARLRVNKVIRVNHAIKFLSSKIEDCVESALCPSNALVKYIEKVQKQTDVARQNYGSILRNGAPFHPIPFFGNLSSARIITVGLNPSSGEFEPWRCWPEKLNAHGLTSRLVGYFRHAHPRPHPWFADLQEAMSIIGCSYNLTAAHIDVSPWPTLAPTTLKKKGREFLRLYNNMLRTEVKRLPNLLRRCKHLKLVIIIGEKQWTGFIQDAVREKFRGKVEVIEKDKLANWVSCSEADLRKLVNWSPNIF